ncbi:MAG: hypothetical protein ACXWQO_06640 [Bdellovibrionota bacterium]
MKSSKILLATFLLLICLMPKAHAEGAATDAAIGCAGFVALSAAAATFSVRYHKNVVTPREFAIGATTGCIGGASGGMLYDMTKDKEDAPSDADLNNEESPSEGQE